MTHLEDRPRCVASDVKFSFYSSLERLSQSHSGSCPKSVVVGLFYNGAHILNWVLVSGVAISIVVHGGSTDPVGQQHLQCVLYVHSGVTQINMTILA